MDELKEIIARMEPEQALKAIAEAANSLLAHIDEEARLDFVVSLVGDAGADKVSSMVNLWLAECMDEGVDPTSMCQSLVHKVAQSKQLMAVADPDILILFESWLDELEEEVQSFLKSNKDASAQDLAANLGISISGAAFLLAKLTKQNT